MEIEKIDPPCLNPASYSFFRMNPLANKGEVLLGHKQEKGILVPVYFRREMENVRDRSIWVIRTFKVEISFSYQRQGLLRREKEMVFERPTLNPESSSYSCPDLAGSNIGKQAVIRTWESLTQKAISPDELKDLLGIPNLNAA